MNAAHTFSSFKIQVFRNLFIISFLFCSLGSMLAQGDLMIYPRRVVFEGRTNIERLTLANTGNETATYTISFLEYKMNEKGQMIIISEAEEGMSFASSNVRFFPRKVTLGPSESQKVKIQLRNAESLADGEYRSHLYFRAEPNQVALGADTTKKDSTLSIELKAVFGISIPCIIRKGEDSTAITITDLQCDRFDAGGQSLSFNLNRKGNMSIYGDITIEYIAPNNKKYEVARMKGVGVYIPLTHRVMKLKIDPPANVDFSAGKLKVSFTHNESRKELAVAEKSLTCPVL